MTEALQLAEVGLAVATVSLTVTKSVVFKPVRATVIRHSRWLGKLVSCPYCFSHWVSFAVVPFVWDSDIAPTLIRIFAVVAIASIANAVMAWGWEHMPPTEMEIEDENAQLRAALAEAQEVLRDYQVKEN